MDEELRLKMLARARNERVIKAGTYEYIQKEKHIVQDSATSEFAIFYEPIDCSEDDSQDVTDNESSEDLAAQILASNFRTGLSQSEVDSILMGYM